MAERDDRAAIGAAVHAFRLVLGRLADPAPRLRADLARAEALIDPDAPLPLLEFDPFEALPAEPLPPGHAPAGESWRDRAGSATPPAASAVQRAGQPGPQGTARAAPGIAREPAWTARDLPGAADTSLTAGPSSGGREGPPGCPPPQRPGWRCWDRLPARCCARSGELRRPRAIRRARPHRSAAGRRSSPGRRLMRPLRRQTGQPRAGEPLGLVRSRRMAPAPRRRPAPWNPRRVARPPRVRRRRRPRWCRRHRRGARSAASGWTRASWPG